MAVKNSNKLDELCRWERISEVNAKLDSGETPNRVHEWIISNGFKISHPMIYQYAKRRKQQIIAGLLAAKTNMPSDDEQEIRRVPIVTLGALVVKQLRNELDALEAIIQLGFESLCNLPTGAVTPKLMLEAIALKHKITDNSYEFQTEFGINCLNEINKRKTIRILEIYEKYLMEDKRDELLAELSTFEHTFYLDTDYYAEYLEVRSRHKEKP